MSGRMPCRNRRNFGDRLYVSTACLWRGSPWAGTVARAFASSSLPSICRSKSSSASRSATPRPIVLRSSPTPWGPWSESIDLLRPSEAHGRYLNNPGGGLQPLRFAPEDVPIDGWLYSPQVVDRFTRTVEGTTSLYWLLSTGKPYQVQLMRSDVRRRG